MASGGEHPGSYWEEGEIWLRLKPLQLLFPDHVMGQS